MSRNGHNSIYGHSLWRGRIFSLMTALMCERGTVTVFLLKLDCKVYCGLHLVLACGTLALKPSCHDETKPKLAHVQSPRGRERRPS